MNQKTKQISKIFGMIITLAMALCFLPWMRVDTLADIGSAGVHISYPVSGETPVINKEFGGNYTYLNTSKSTITWYKGDSASTGYVPYVQDGQRFVAGETYFAELKLAYANGHFSQGCYLQDDDINLTIYGDKQNYGIVSQAVFSGVIEAGQQGVETQGTTEWLVVRTNNIICPMAASSRSDVDFDNESPNELKVDFKTDPTEITSANLRQDLGCAASAIDSSSGSNVDKTTGLFFDFKVDCYEEGSTTAMAKTDRFKAGKKYTAKIMFEPIRKDGIIWGAMGVYDSDVLLTGTSLGTTVAEVSADHRKMTCSVTFGPVKAAKYDVYYEANGGTGTMGPDQKSDGDEFALPACKFTAPAGKEFDKWDLGAVGTKITITDNVTLKALWKDATAAPAPVDTPKPAAAGTELKDGNTSYTTVASDVPAVEYNGTTDTGATITIPDVVTINGVEYKVESIKANAFKGNKKVTKVIIGKNVKSIGKNAFANCTSLKEVDCQSEVLAKIGAGAFSGDKKLAKMTLKTTKLTNKTVGKNALKKTSGKLKVKVPKAAKKAYKKFFKNKGNKKVKIK